MKPIAALPHGFLDYATGLLLLVSPWMFGFDNLSTNATYTMVVMGIVVIGLSLITNYPLGLIKTVPFALHGKIETAGAVVLLSSPWLFHFSNLEVARNLAIIVALAWLGVVALTNYSTYEFRRPIH
jgi:hypothetical protein